MARIQKVICASCTGIVRVGESFCDHCGQPTTWASYEERIDWEVRQWRNARSRSGTSEVIQPRYAQSRGSSVAVAEAEMDAPPQRAVFAASAEAARQEVLRESLFARLRSFARRLLDLFNARNENVRVDDVAVPAHGGDDAPEPIARPTLVVVEDLEPETPEPVVVVPEVVASEPVAAPEVVAPEVVGPAEPAKPAAAVTDAASSPAPRPRPPRKRPNRPTNKELLQRTLTTLERVEARLHHLEEEIEEIDQAVRKAPAAAPDEDDDLEPPAAAGPFGYI